jgi:hypothetical protein
LLNEEREVIRAYRIRELELAYGIAEIMHASQYLRHVSRYHRGIQPQGLLDPIYQRRMEA